MDYTNKRAPGERGAGGTSVCWDRRDHITTEALQETSNLAPAAALLIRLYAEFPVFREYRPLSIGIREALHAALPNVVHKTINRALALHCRSDLYLKALAAGGPRYALGGAQSGEVTEEHRAAAVLVLARRAEKSGKPRNPAVVSAAPKLPRLAKPGRPA